MLIQNKYNNKYNLLILIGSLVIFAINQLPCLVDMRPVMYDEPWYMNPAYNLMNGNGLLNTLVGSGGNTNFVAPLMMAGMMSIFGPSLLVVRMVAVICGFITLWILHLILNEIKASSWTRVLTLGIFVSISLINSVFRYVRPEFAVAMFVMMGLLFTLRYIRTQSWMDMILLCISVYLASCSHPYSLYFFAFVGLHLLVNCIKLKDYRRISQILLLVVTAILVVISLLIVQQYANPNQTTNGILDRLSISSISAAIITCAKHVFLKHGVYTIPFFLINVYAIVKKIDIRWLAIVNIIFLCTFPFIFSSDLAMVGNSVLYFSLGSIIVFAAIFSDLEKSLTHNKLRVVLILCLLFCIGNYSISIAFNYLKRYEKCNSILVKEVDSIIPDGALVFGAIRFWPFKMNTNYYCDHNGKELTPTEYDYLLFNSQDEMAYKDVHIVKNVKKSLDNYELIYTRDTKQYGTITIWKHRKNHEHTIQ